MPEKVLITGIGTISSIGNDVAETLDSLVNGRSGVGTIQHLPTNHQGELPAAEVKASDEELMQKAGVKDPTAYSRTTLLGLIAAKEALDDAGLKEKPLDRTGLISANTTGGMGKTEEFYHDFLENDSRSSYINLHDCGDSTERIADELAIKDRVTTISTACSSSANSIMLGARMIKAGIVDRVLAGGIDSLTRFTLNGFNSLYIVDKEPCRPFDNTRQGLNLGEGAGFVVLESKTLTEKTGSTPKGEVKGYSNANDAYHQTASSPEGNGAYMAMKEAVDMSGLGLDHIDYVNVHGTGTPNNDLSEGKALLKLFGEDNVPKFSSTKAFTGHTLGAAGGIEAVFAVLAMQEGLIFPNLNWKEPMEEFNLRPETELLKGKQVRSVLSNSFGFGGNNSSLLLTKY